MQNFNTNQTRHFYVAGADKTGSTISNELDIQVKKTATDEIYFLYKNADGILTRSDTIALDKIKSISATAAADMANPLFGQDIAVKAGVDLTALVGKAIELVITVHQVIDYDDSDTRTFVASVIGDSSNTASASALYNAMGKAVIAAVQSPDKAFPLLDAYVVKSGTATKVTKDSADVSSATGLVLVEGLQKYVRGKLSGEPCKISVAFRVGGLNGEDIQWGEATQKTVATLSTSYAPITPATFPAVWTLADLEYFALGERGDYYRGALWPNEYTPTFAISDSDIKNKVATYKVLNLEYFWSGNAENVQKSPRLIQIAAKVTGTGSTAVDPVATLLSTIEGFIAGTSGSGSGA